MATLQSSIDVLPLPVADGGTGAATLTGPVIGNGASAMTAAAQLIVANGGTGVATIATNGLVYGNGASAVGVVAAGTTGQVLVATTGSAPTWANMASTNIVDVTGTSQAMSAGTTYIADNATTTVVFTLPASGALGDTLSIVGNGAAGWKIAQNANQAIKVNTLTTTTGTGGSLNSTTRYNDVTLRCVVAGASTIWNAQAGNGSYTIV